MRFVFDTNVLIDGLSDDLNAQNRLLDAVRDGEVEAAITPAVTREYRRILGRFTVDNRYQSRLEDFFAVAIPVEPAHLDVVIDDNEDKKFIAAAVGGQANALVTNDHHLLDIGEVAQVRIVTPTEAWAMVEEETGGSNMWHDFIRGLGIAK